MGKFEIHDFLSELYKIYTYPVEEKKDETPQKNNVININLNINLDSSKSDEIKPYNLIKKNNI